MLGICKTPSNLVQFPSFHIERALFIRTEASDLPEINLVCLSLALDVLPFPSLSNSCHSLSAAWLSLVTVRNVDFKQGGNAWLL